MQELYNFRSGFTKQQKAAIIGALILVAKSDGHAHPNEIKQIEESAHMLDIDFDDPIFMALASKGNDEIVRILNTLDKNQKEWFIVSLHSLVAADGKIPDSELNYALGIAEEIGIDEEQYILIIQKTQALMNRFFSKS